MVKNNDIYSLLTPKTEENFLYGKPVPEDLKNWFLQVYDELDGHIPKCGFNDVLLREVGRDYASDAE